MGGRFTVSFASSLLWREVGGEGPILVLLLLHSSCLVPVFFFSHVLGWPVCFCLFWGFIIHLGKCNTWSFLFWVFGFRSGIFFFTTIWVGILCILSILVFFFPSLGMGGRQKK